MSQFIAHGYEGASLEDIAECLGLTRQAVLYHYGTKEELLRSIVVPGVEAIERTWNSLRVSDPPTPQEREEVLTVLVDTLCEHRGVLAVLTRFTNQTEVASIMPAVVELNQKAVRLLGGSAVETDPLLRVRVVATLAALGGVMTSRLDLTLDTPAERAELVKGCVAMLGSGTC